MRCECCSSENMRELDAFRDYQHIRCEECGFERFLRTEAHIPAQLYENDADYTDDLTVATTSSDLLLWHHEKAVKFLQSRFPSGQATILDVGCFNGFFVKKMLSVGFDAYGIDFNTTAVAYGQERLGLGFRISTQTLKELLHQGKRFDAITLFEVLEHLPDARNFLADVVGLLKKGGIVVLSTPNNNMCWRPALDYPPHHLARYTTLSLCAGLSHLGMNVLYVAEQMSSYELARHYVGTFFRAKDSESLRGGEFKHKKVTTFLRRGMNKLRKVFGALLMPIDGALYLAGIRYISQIIVAEKKF